MKTKIKIIKNSLLKEHEKVRKIYLIKLMKKIKLDKCINNPIVVDKNTMIILDGHHRFNVIKLLGLTHAPVCLC